MVVDKLHLVVAYELQNSSDGSGLIAFGGTVLIAKAVVRAMD